MSKRVDFPGFDSRWERCKNRASRPSQGTVNWSAVSNLMTSLSMGRKTQPTNQPEKVDFCLCFFFKYNYMDIRWTANNNKTIRNTQEVCSDKNNSAFEFPDRI